MERTKNHDKPNPGKQLREARERFGWNQTQAADEIGRRMGVGPLNRATVAHWEGESRLPGRDAALALEELFGVPATDWARLKRSLDREAA